jgi:hypothetical protein
VNFITFAAKRYFYDKPIYCHSYFVGSGRMSYIYVLSSSKTGVTCRLFINKIKDLGTAIEDTIEDSDELESLLLSLSSEDDLDSLFHPLENFRITEMLLGREKARLKRNVSHSSWLRIYAIKVEQGVYIITGGAIKLTLRMDEREHTRRELEKMEKVRQYLLEENIVDEDGFLDFVSTI